MGSINILQDETVVKIAAGEVIDRPSSVIRELIDNAVDASSDSIRIMIEDGGKSYIEIQDNGSGMDADDLDVCFLNHSTSKISSFDDIYRLQTMGFRGEALASIAEVASVIIHSSDGKHPGKEIEIKFGKKINSISKPRNQGTTVIVEDIFEELPVRKKFLGTPATEQKRIYQEIIKRLLPHPEIGIEFYSNGKLKYSHPSRKTRLERIVDFYPDVLDYLIPVEKNEGKYQLSGFITRPSFLRRNRNYEYFYVNERAVEWKNFYFALKDAYGNLIPKGYFPGAFLFMNIDSDEVDFNVHPMKKEIRFDHERKIQEFVYETISETLQEDIGISPADEGELQMTPFESKIGEAISDFYSGASRYHSGGNQYNQYRYSSTEPFQQNDDRPEDFSVTRGERSYQPVAERYEINSQTPEEKVARTAEKELLSELRIVGIVFSTFIVLEGEGRLYFVDQHAAHERINYEKLKQNYHLSNLNKQNLLVPVSIEISQLIVDDFQENLPVLNAMGFEVESFGGTEFVIRTAPVYLSYDQVEQTVRAFADTLMDYRGKNFNSEDMIDDAIKQMACKRSIKSGDRISEQEIKELLKNLEKTENRFSCPHGRPVVFSVSRENIEKTFKRTGFQ